MILKFCNDNFLFYITHTKYFDILCCFVIFFLIFLIFLAFNNKFFNKLQKNKIKMIFIILFLGLFVGFLVFLLLWLLNKDAFNGCSTKYYENIYFKTENTINETVNNLKNSKVIIVGDSRMQLINDDKDFGKPFNFEFVAKGGSKINWLKNTALNRTKKILNNNDFDYYVVVNMGVNDLDNETYNGEEIAEQYFEIYEKLASSYPKTKLFILSVNPIDESKINEFWNENNRTNKKIEKFNKTIRNKLTKSTLNNIYYCNSYDELQFETIDGLHYTEETNRKIINYIANKCIKFN